MKSDIGPDDHCLRWVSFTELGFVSIKWLLQVPPDFGEHPSVPSTQSTIHLCFLECSVYLNHLIQTEIILMSLFDNRKPWAFCSVETCFAMKHNFHYDFICIMWLYYVISLKIPFCFITTSFPLQLLLCCVTYTMQYMLRMLFLS